MKDLLKKVEEKYHQQEHQTPQNNKIVQELYQQWLNGIFSVNAKLKLHTQYHTREKVINPLAIKW